MLVRLLNFNLHPKHLASSPRVSLLHLGPLPGLPSLQLCHLSVSLFTVNQPIGLIYVSFLSIDLPVSAYALVTLLLGVAQTRVAKFGMLLLIGQGFIASVPVHWLLAKFTKQLHASSNFEAQSDFSV